MSEHVSYDSPFTPGISTDFVGSMSQVKHSRTPRGSAVAALSDIHMDFVPDHRNSDFDHENDVIGRSVAPTGRVGHAAIVSGSSFPGFNPHLTGVPPAPVIVATSAASISATAAPLIPIVSPTAAPPAPSSHAASSHAAAPLTPTKDVISHYRQRGFTDDADMARADMFRHKIIALCGGEEEYLNSKKAILATLLPATRFRGVYPRSFTFRDHRGETVCLDHIITDRHSRVISFLYFLLAERRPPQRFRHR